MTSVECDDNRFRMERSLGLLTAKFVSLLKNSKDGILDLNVVLELELELDASTELHPLRSLVTSVLGHFGPFFKDRNDRGPK